MGSVSVFVIIQNYKNKMASRKLAQLTKTRQIFRKSTEDGLLPVQTLVLQRRMKSDVLDQFGYIKPEPQQQSLLGASVKIAVVSFGLYLGVLVSTSMVSYLEEYNIFV